MGTWGDEQRGGARVLGVESYLNDPFKWNEQAEFEHRIFRAMRHEPLTSTADIERILKIDFRKAQKAMDRMEQRGVIEGNAGNLGGYIPHDWISPRVFAFSLADMFEAWNGPMVSVRGNVMARPYLDRESTPEFWQETGVDELKTDPQGWQPLRMSDVRTWIFQHVIDKTPFLTWMILTKRPENIGRMWPAIADLPECEETENVRIPRKRRNVWLIASASEQATYNRNWAELKKCRDLAPVLGISYEPALGPIDFAFDAGTETGGPQGWVPADIPDLIIYGGESGSGHRPAWIDDAFSTVEQCQDAGVACFIKQLGQDVRMGRNMLRGEHFSAIDMTGMTGTKPYEPSKIYLKARKGERPDEWPERLRVRQLPEHERIG